MSRSLAPSRVKHPRAAEADRLVRVDSDADAFRVVTCQPVRTGEKILTLVGTLVSTPSRHTLQVGTSVHMQAPDIEALPLGTAPVWLYLNHSCAPNASIRGHDLFALAPIAAGEEVTFDYNTTEFEMASPFHCMCGHCDGHIIRGFRFLSPDQQRALGPRLAAHLRRLLDGTPDC